jgi:hypothetical protein
MLVMALLRRDGGTGRRSGLKKLGCLCALNGEVPSFFYFPVHPNSERNQSVLFREFLRGAVVA